MVTFQFTHSVKSLGWVWAVTWENIMLKNKRNRLYKRYHWEVSSKKFKESHRVQDEPDRGRKIKTSLEPCTAMHCEFSAQEKLKLHFQARLKFVKNNLENDWYWKHITIISGTQTYCQSTKCFHFINIGQSWDTSIKIKYKPKGALWLNHVE